MEDFFDDFDGEFMEDEPFEDDIEEDESEVKNSVSDEPVPDNDLNHNADRSNEHEWDDAYWIGGAMGWAYEEGRRERRKRRNQCEDDIEI